MLPLGGRWREEVRLNLRHIEERRQVEFEEFL